MGPRTERIKRAVYVGRVARRSGLVRVLRELGVWGNRPATREGAQEFRRALEELGTTYIKLGQLLSSRPDLLPDEYIEEPGIEHKIDLDLALLRSTAELLESRSERAQLLQARALADELEVHLRAELNSSRRRTMRSSSPASWASTRISSCRR